MVASTVKKRMAIPNDFSFFAATLKRRRAASAGSAGDATAAAPSPSTPPARPALREQETPRHSSPRAPGPPLAWEEEENDPLGLGLGFDLDEPDEM